MPVITKMEQPNMKLPVDDAVPPHVQRIRGHLDVKENAAWRWIDIRGILPVDVNYIVVVRAALHQSMSGIMSVNHEATL